MSGDWQGMIGTPQCLDWRDLCARLPDGCANLLFLDPPYNIGVFCKMPPVAYLDWCREWIAEGSRVLAPNGAFWVSHKDPAVLVDISREIARHGRGRINWVTWDKYHVNEHSQIHALPESPYLRSFVPITEYLIYHADEGNWTAQCDQQRGFIFEPLRAYLDGERQRAGFTPEDCNAACGHRQQGGMAGRHYFSPSQWCLPTAENYEKLRQAFNRHGGEYLRREYEDLRREYEDLRREYEDLRREYEDLRREYEHLRYTFNNPGKVSSVWQIPPAPSNGHPTPKPEPLLARIIETTSNPGDVVLDFFAGSFTTAVVAQRLGRRWICGDNSPKYVALGQQRLTQPEQLGMGIPA